MVNSMRGLSKLWPYLLTVALTSGVLIFMKFVTESMSVLLGLLPWIVGADFDLLS